MRFCESKFDANFVLTIGLDQEGSVDGREDWRGSFWLQIDLSGVDFKWKQVERQQRKLKIQVLGLRAILKHYLST